MIHSAYSTSLDRRSIWLRLLLQAVAVIMLLIGFNFVNDECSATHTFWKIYQPKLEPTRLAESVVKIKSSENVKGDFTLAKFPFVLGRNACDIIAVDRSTGEPHGWGQFESAHYFILRRNEARVKREFMDFNIYPIYHVIGGSLTTIFEPKAELRRQRVTAESSGVFDGQIGPQLLLRSFLRASYQITGGDPQKDSGKSNDNRERSNDRFRVVVGKMPQTDEIDVERDRDRGNTFLKILGCAAGILILNTALKWLGTFNNPKDSG